MPSPISVNISHSLGKAEARRRIEEGFGPIQQRLATGFMGMVSFQQHWEGDRLRFEGGALGQKILGTLDVTDTAVQVELQVPDLLAAVAKRLGATLKTQTAGLLEKK